MKPLVSVVIPTFHRRDLLARCLEALDGQSLCGEFEVIVCDDAADESLAKWCANYAPGLTYGLRYIPVAETQGPAAARNRGWRAAQADVIAFTDDDCIPQPLWLRKGCAALSEADAAAGAVIVPLPERPTDYERDASGLQRARFVTANCFCRREALEWVGGFDERYRAAWREDTDLECALRSLGRRIVRASDAVVVHPVRPERFAISLRQQRKGQYDQLLRRRHPLLAGEVIAPYPWWYVAYTLACAAAVLSAGAWPALSAFTAVVALAMAAGFMLKRLRAASKSPRHVGEMALTSIFIPWLSVYYQALGWWRFRHCPEFVPSQLRSESPDTVEQKEASELVLHTSGTASIIPARQ